MNLLNSKIMKLKLSIHNNKLGKLITYDEFIKKNKFKVKNIFIIYGKKNAVRGCHAHKKSTQILLCVNGQIKIKCYYKKKSRVYMLEKFKSGLLLPPLVWSEFKFLKSNSQLLVVSDYPYDEKEYIRNQKDFLINYHA